MVGKFLQLGNHPEDEIVKLDNGVDLFSHDSYLMPALSLQRVKV